MAKVLIMEDNPAFRQQLCDVISSAGFQTWEAKNGTLGLRLFEAHQPDVVVTDLIMEGGEGIEAILRIRQLDPNVYIIAMSGNPDYLSSSKKLGADLVLLKPFRAPELLAAIERPKL